MNKIRVLVSGAAGQIAYSLLFRLVRGEVFGEKVSIDLVLLDISNSIGALKGVVMEIMDCAFPLLNSVVLTDIEEEAFESIDYAFLIGARPRSLGMERFDLLKENGKIFASQGKALNQSKHAKVLVVGNPCNTNALILMHNAKDLQPENIRSMSRLDQNRAMALIASKAGVEVSDIHKVGIFGNHSSTMVVDYCNIQIKKKKAVDVIQNLSWFQKDFFIDVQNRGMEIIRAKGTSSAASAANAAIQSVYDWVHDKELEEFSSVGIYSHNNPYGIADDLFFSFPLVGGKVVGGLIMDSFLKEKIDETEKELLKERDLIREFL